ncbi:succinic semialdehyde dehydrogenase [Halobium salinum]|uniref:Succinic semialdehyde dehydrogenase n=1 Tax=Halobium salinum TaxID=1364940 RepID=A0ABD5P9J6_9EURY|nr:succinic semialdehyde dehydrogenase [Halobium salinum]
MNPESLPSTTSRDRLRDLAATVDTDADDTLEVEAPATGEVVGEVPACTAADLDRAVERAREARREWTDRSARARAAVLERFHDRLLDRREEALDLVQLESGKARMDAMSEVLDVANTARYYANEAESTLESEDRAPAVPGATRTRVHHRPVGVVGAISPWNYPLTLAVSDLLPALLAGNAVLLKPDEETPYTALWVADLLRGCGLPEGLFPVVTGEGPELGPALVEAVDFVQFTGSTAVGKEVAERAGRELTPASMELGGKNPLLVLADADVEKTASGAVTACFSNAGQLCIAAERLYVHTDVYDDFLDAFVGATRDLDLGVGYDYDAEMGSLQNADQLSKTREHLDDAVEKGAEVLTGGRERPDVGPYVHEPTVLTGVTEEMTLYREETFGPLVAVYEVDDVKEAVRRANDSPYGLNGSVWTEDERLGEHVAEHLECGTVNVNDAYLATWGAVDAPMGGMNDSGLGRRHGPEGLLKFTESQTVAVNDGPVLGGSPSGFPGAWWERGMTAYLRARRKLGWSK